MERDLEWRVQLNGGDYHAYVSDKINVVKVDIDNKILDNYWSYDEDEIIREYYPIEGKKCSKRLINICCRTY